MKLDAIFSPKNIGTLTIPNRLTVTAAVTLNCDEHGCATENFISYYEAKAKGGWGLIITEDYAVDPMGKSFRCVPGLWEDAQIAGHAELTRRVHQYDSKVFAQIYHSGRQTNPGNLDGALPQAPTAIIDPKTRTVPRELTTEEIQTLVVRFGEAAYRAKQAGFDGVEIHGGHGYLVNEFFSHYSNKRIDQYGGNILNRCRFALEIIAEIKKQCGQDFPVGMRVSADEYVPGGLTIEDTKVIARILEEGGLDVINVSVGVNASIEKVAAPAAVRHGVYMDLASEIKKAVSIPVIGLGRINDPFLANSVVEDGKCDFVGMLRASMADPDMPNKAREGRFEDIITCIGCLIGCSGQLAKAQPATCVFNPAMGKETELCIRKAAVPKKVVVVGGGVGGMETAIIAARCGHSVTLLEKSDRLGGQFYYAAIPPEKGEISSYLVWQQTQLKKLGVEIRMNTEATVELLDEMQPDAVVIAAGAAPFIAPIPGAQQDHVFSAISVLGGANLPGKTCVVIGGGMVGAETAHHLINYGYTVNAIVEMLPEVLTDLPYNPKYYLLKDFREAGVPIMTSTTAKSIGKDTVTVTRDGEDVTLQADFVVMATGAKSNNQLLSALADKPYRVEIIGDALKAPRRALDAIHEGYRVALSL